jgi:hypothetical protein
MPMHGTAARQLLTWSSVVLCVALAIVAPAGAQAPARDATPPPSASPAATPPPGSSALPQVVQPATQSQPPPLDSSSTPLPQILRPVVPPPPPAAPHPQPQGTPTSPTPTPQAATPAPPPATPPQPTSPQPTGPATPSAAPPAAPATPSPPPEGSAQPPPPHALEPATPSSQPVPAEVAAEQIAPVELTGLLGHIVVGDNGTELGRIVDLLVDAQGRVRAVVLDVGGFMGLGNRKVAVAWSALRFAAGKNGPVVSTEIPPDRIKSWADYIVGRPVAILGAAVTGH